MWPTDLRECPIDLPARIGEVIDRWRWPRRRARLPGRGRLRELARDPAGLLRRSRPDRVRRVGRIADDERLIGLLMIRDEDDVLADTLAAAVRWFDRILVLDGTEDPDRVARTDEILARFAEVVWHGRDRDLFPDGVTDGARQVLLEEARARYGVDHWIGILHADEFLDQDPRPMLAARHPGLDPSIRVRVAHTFLHVDDESSHGCGLDVRSRVRHQMWPGVPESRFFFDDGSRAFDPALHSKVLPRSFRAGPLVDGYVITQYNERDPDQLVARARQRAASGWQLGHYARLLRDPPEVFVTTLDRPDARFAPEFAGDRHGPFRAVPIAACPHAPPRDPPPRVVSTDADDAAAGVDLDRVAVAELLTLLAEPSRAGARRWVGAVRNRDPGRDVLALVAHTATVLGSDRPTEGQRQRAAAECLLWLPGGDGPWVGRVDARWVDDVAALLATAATPPAPSAT